MLPLEAGDLLRAVRDADGRIVIDVPDPEEDLQGFRAPVEALGHRVAHAVSVFQADLLPRGAEAPEVGGGRLARGLALGAHIVHQVVDVEHVAAGEDAGDGALPVLPDHRAVGAGVDLHARLAAQLVLGQQAHGEQQGVAVEDHLRAGDGAALFIHLRHHHLLQPVPAPNVGDGVAQIEGNVEVVEALDDVPGQTAGVGHQLHAGQDLGPLQGHAAGHDQADVAGAQDDHPPTHHIALHVQKALGGAGGEDAGAAGAGDGDGAPGALPAAHSQDDGPGLDGLVAVPGADGVQDPVLVQIQHHGIGADLNVGVLHHVDEAARVLGAGELLLEAVQAEAVVDALVQDAARLVVAL